MKWAALKLQASWLSSRLRSGRSRRWAGVGQPPESRLGSGQAGLFGDNAGEEEELGRLPWVGQTWSWGPREWPTRHSVAEAQG